MSTHWDKPTAPHAATVDPDGTVHNAESGPHVHDGEYCSVCFAAGWRAGSMSARRLMDSARACVEARCSCHGELGQANDAVLLDELAAAVEALEPAP